MSLLEMNHIRKSFDGVEVIKDISLSVEKGEILAIIGPSGSGKSTLLRCATMLETIGGGENPVSREKGGVDGRREAGLSEKAGTAGDPVLFRACIPELQSVSTFFGDEKYYGCADQSAEEKERRSVCGGESAA